MLLDPNILACKDRAELLTQLAESRAVVDFTQGLDARFITKETCESLSKIRTKMYHLAFDFMKNEKAIIRGLKTFADNVKLQSGGRNCCVYVLTNFNTTFEEDMYRVMKIQEIGLLPDVRIYRKNSLSKRHILRDMQRWCNNRFIYHSQPDFMQYIPRKDGKSIQEIYFTKGGAE